MIFRIVAASLLYISYSVNCSVGCADISFNNQIDGDVLWEDMSVLASAQMEGRKTATLGGKMAAQYIFQRYQQIDLKTFPSFDEYFQHFSFASAWSEQSGTNVLGWLEGNKNSQEFIVVTAHYDHLGTKGGKVFNGADDNASGVAALLSLAQYIAVNGSNYSIVFVATDAEEKGLYGAKAFLADPPITLQSIKYNLNLDMLGEGGRRNRLYATPSKGHAGLNQVIRSVIDKAGLCLVKGHRRSRRNVASRPHINWRLASDHGAFSKKNIPYVFLGVAEHPRYHSVNDTPAYIDRLFFSAAAETALSLLLSLDAISDTE